MPAQVTDIKEFLEIARRKDAKCKSHHLQPVLKTGSNPAASCMNVEVAMVSLCSHSARQQPKSLPFAIAKPMS